MTLEKLNSFLFVVSQYPHYARGWGGVRDRCYVTTPNRVRSGDIERRKKKGILVFKRQVTMVADAYQPRA